MVSVLLQRESWNCGKFPFRFLKRAHIIVVREGTLFIAGGGGGLRRAGSLVNKGQNCFILNRGRVTVFLARKKLPHVASILYLQAKLPVKINLNYLQVSNGRKLFENSVYSLFGFGNHPRSSSFHFSGLALSLVPVADVLPT